MGSLRLCDYILQQARNATFLWWLFFLLSYQVTEEPFPRLNGDNTIRVWRERFCNSKYVYNVILNELNCTLEQALKSPINHYSVRRKAWVKHAELYLECSVIINARKLFSSSSLHQYITEAWMRWHFHSKLHCQWILACLYLSCFLKLARVKTSW